MRDVAHKYAGLRVVNDSTRVVCLECLFGQQPLWPNCMRPRGIKCPAGTNSYYVSDVPGVRGLVERAAEAEVRRVAIRKERNEFRKGLRKWVL